jgi:predicted amidophosphoribosyltransferase
MDGKLHQLEASKPKQKEKFGNIKTCPACGASVKAFQIKCDDCGYEFTVSTPPSTYFKNKKLARPLSKIIINYDKRRPDERTL